MGCGHSYHSKNEDYKDTNKNEKAFNLKHVSIDAKRYRIDEQSQKKLSEQARRPGNNKISGLQGEEESETRDPFERELKHLSAKAAVSEALISDSDNENDLSHREFHNRGHSSAIIDVLVRFLRNHVLFQNCSDESLITFAKNMEMETIDKNTEVIRQGDSIRASDKMYLLQIGFLQVQISGGQLHGPKIFTQTAGWIFGEIALICETVRSATIKTLTKCTLFSCDRRAIMTLAASRTLLFIRRLPFLKTMSDNQVFEILSKAQNRIFRDGEYIIKYGDIKDTNVHFIRRGNVTVRRPILQGSQIENTSENAEMKQVAIMTRGQMLGQRVILTGKMRSADCIAIGEVETVSFTSADFLIMDTPFLNRWLDQEAITTVLTAISGHSPIAIEQNCNELYQFHYKRYKQGDTLYDKGSKIRGLHIVRLGQITSSSPRADIQEAGGFSYFGEVHSVRTFDHDFVAKTDISILVEDNLDGQRRHSSDTSESVDDDDSIDFKDLKIGKMIGIGTSGRVFLITHVPTGKIYALKAMDKSKLRHAKQIEHTQNEIRIIKKINHPFCTKFIAAYQDLRHLYVLQEFIAGGEFFGYMQSGQGFNENVTRFYAANVLLALQHLHEKSVIYRDLKPENLLLDRNGYIKIADFGFAKHLKLKQRTYTICGTPAYQAPEIISKTGTGFEADIWSLGILIYEMSFGKTPFENADHSEDPLQIYKKVLSGRFIIPKTASKDLADLLYGILVIKGNQRLSLNGIRQHKWFKMFPWKDLEEMKLNAPFKPELTSLTDTSHFDTFDEITSFIDISPDNENAQSRLNQSILWPGWTPIRI